jgi:hypothetical protein
MHFDSNGCWVVTNKSETTLVRGTLSNSKHLYVLTTKTPHVQRKSNRPIPLHLHSTLGSQTLKCSTAVSGTVTHDRS